MSEASVSEASFGFESMTFASGFSLLDGEVSISTSSDDTSSSTVTAETKKVQRGLLTYDHIKPIMNRKWSTVLSWVTFHPDQVANLVDREGLTALHHACLYNAPASVIEAMLYAAPELAKTSNEEGELPMHWAVRLSLPTEVLELLVSHNHEGGFKKDIKGHSPLSLIWERHANRIMDTYRSQGQETMTLLSCWKRIMVLVWAVSGVTDNPMSSSPLHAIVCCPCPPRFLRFATMVYRDDVQKKDAHGNLPLHIAASVPLQESIAIEVLLKEYPKAASIKDSTGRLPLHLIIASAKGTEGQVIRLLDEYPDALWTKDPITGLLPFLHAVVQTHEQEAVALSMVYRLLKKDPGLLVGLLPTKL